MALTDKRTLALVEVTQDYATFAVENPPLKGREVQVVVTYAGWVEFGRPGMMEMQILRVYNMPAPVAAQQPFFPDEPAPVEETPSG